MELEAAAVQTRISASLDASVASIQSLRECASTIESVSEVVIATLRAGRKVLTAGNGGSAAESLHMAEELMGRFRGNRMSLPAVSLVADCTALTCIGNDFGFDHIFSRQVEGLGKEGDVLFLFSTSGRAVNLTMALDVAKARGLRTVALLGRDGGALAGRADYEIVVPGSATERIQEAHQVLMHLILDEVEHAFAVVGGR